jgi:hypothetical protein
MYYWTQKIRKKQKKPWNNIKIGIFSMSKLIMFLFQPFWTPPFNFDNEKNSFEYVMDFEKNRLLLHIINNYKVHHILQIFRKV